MSKAHKFTARNVPLIMSSLTNLRTQPSYEDVLQTLESLQIQPSTWNGPSNDSPKALLNGGSSENSEPIDKAVILNYLMSVIASDFEWFEDSLGKDGEVILATRKRDILLEMASKRVAERCGRSAMPEMTRTWVIPASARIPELRFDIREPPLTGDNLGLKTWGTAYTIAKKLEDIGSKHFTALLNESKESSGCRDYVPSVKALELGAGTGLVGIAAAAIFGIHVLLTDLPAIKENLLHNISENLPTVADRPGAYISGDILDWEYPEATIAILPCQNFEIILAADPLYDEHHPALVAGMIEKLLQANGRALVAVPLRDPNTKSMAAKFETIMRSNAFKLAGFGEEICRDDWESEGSEQVSVRWTVWARSSSQSI